MAKNTGSLPHRLKTIRIARAAIRFARKYHIPDFGCLDCGKLPVTPAVCYCGHTRCAQCIGDQWNCPCGHLSPRSFTINITVRDIIKKITMVENSPPQASGGTSDSEVDSDAAVILEPQFKRRRHRRCNPKKCRCFSQKQRISHARDLMKLGEYREAIPHFAHAVAAKIPAQRSDGKYAFQQLLRCVKEVQCMGDGNELKLTREICLSVRAKWHQVNNLLPNVELSDLECPICLETLSGPVTTPCGHTFCRMCIARTVRTQKYCAMCRFPLDDLAIALTGDTSFVTAVLKAKNFRAKVNSESHFIPIFNCTVAFPTIPCPILILAPYHRHIIQRILDSGSRRFGMVTTYKDGTLAVSGTIVEVRDCVQLQDGRTILSTVGVNRFRTLNRSFKAESHIAQVVDLKDITPTEDEYASLNLERLAQSITEKVMKWLSTLTIPILTDIEDAFGPMPRYKDEYRWWTNPDCPKWLWWIIAILPFSPELQVLMLSTIHLHKRMLAVSRTLDVIKHIGLHPSICY